VADDVERSEEPTPKRREEARKEGQIAISQDAFVFANLFSVTLALGYLGNRALIQSMHTFQELWTPRDDLSMADGIELLRIAFAAGGRIALPVLLAAMGAGIFVGQLQTRGNIAVKRLSPSLGKLSPRRNLGRLLGTQNLVELPKSILKLILIGGLMAGTVWGRLDDFLGLAQLPLLASAGYQLSTLLSAFMAGCFGLFVLAAADYGFQLYRTEQSLKMSHSDVKEERRQFEGDPLVKSRMRALQMERARTRMMSAVPKADVIITNPTHVSVALSYQRGEMRSPKVLAKGRGLIALRIREIARESGVPIVENPPLARALYRAVKVNQEIPERLFQAVAQVLAYVYRLDPRRNRPW
jgi:flagellar biosynthesis protein FlhB